MPEAKKHLSVYFYADASGNKPVEKWLNSLEKHEQETIEDDIKTVQFGWPLGMPLVRPLGKGLREIRSTLFNKIARIIFTMIDNKIILLHGFIKKSQKTPPNELEIAKRRASNLKS